MGFSAGRTPKIYMQVGRSSAQSIPSTGTHAVIWNQTSFDPYGFNVEGTPDIFIPVGAAGFYTISAEIWWADSALGQRGVILEYQSAQGGFTTFIHQDYRSASGATMRTPAAMSPGFQLQQGDRIRLLVSQNSGAPLDLIQSSGYAPALHMVKVA